MEIVYLTLLSDNPSDEPEGAENRFYNIPMTEEEIGYLEMKYNSAKKFPTALRELLFLSGKGSYVNDILFAGNLEESPNPQEEMNDQIREDLTNFNNNVNPISRPFYVIDGGASNGVFEFVFLDEGDDPPVYGSVTDYSETPLDWGGNGKAIYYKSISEMIRVRVVGFLKRSNVPVNYGENSNC